MARDSEVLRRCRLGINGYRAWEKVKWTGSRTYFTGGDPQITSGGCQTAVAQQELNGADIRSPFQ